MSNIIKTYYYQSIRIREADNYFSLSDIEKATGESFADWNKLPSSQDYLRGLAGTTYIPVVNLVDIKLAPAPGSDVDGIWGHPGVAISFADWCSPNLAGTIEEWLTELPDKGSWLAVPPAKVAGLPDLSSSQDYADQVALLYSITQNMLKLEQEHKQLQVEAAEIAKQLASYS